MVAAALPVIPNLFQCARILIDTAYEIFHGPRDRLYSGSKSTWMRIANKQIRDAVLNGIPKTGPPSLRSRWARARYQSPEGLGPAFDEALKLVNNESAALRKRAESLPAGSPEQEMLLAKADLHNPEVKYNHRIGAGDATQPVFRYLWRRDWQAHDMLVLMQRIEQHHVIPDTLPTLEPRSDVRLQFVTPTRRWLEPGEWVQNSVCERVPQLQIRDFDVPLQSQLYTVLIVNPDVPDLATDSFSTSLHFAATNVKAPLTDPMVDWTKANVWADYVPPHPEKNAPGQRLCVWVFRQTEKLPDTAEIPRSKFDIRAFADEYRLDAVGAHLWRTKWDMSTPAVVAKYGLPKGNVYFRARTMHPEDALLHIRDRQKWAKLYK